MNRKSSIIKKETENIKKAIDQFPWVMRFTNIDVKERETDFFNKTIKKIMLHYLLHEIFTCSDWETPWINKDIKKVIPEKNQATSHVIKIRATHSLLTRLNLLQSFSGSLFNQN